MSAQSIQKKLFPYQKAGHDFALAAFRHSKGAFIGDEMGLGKSIQSLAVADTLQERTLYICPAGLVDKTRYEIEKHLPRKRSWSIDVRSYTELSNPTTLSFVTRQRYGLTICDEAHYLKDFTATRTRAVLGAPGDRHKTVAAVSEKMLGLSGTWPPNRVGETYPWLLRTNHPLALNKTELQFLYKYAEWVDESPFGVRHRGIKDDAEFRAQLKKNFIRRTMDTVAPDLPPGTHTILPIECDLEMYGNEQKLLRELLRLAGHPETDINFIEQKPDFLDLLLKKVPGFDRLSEFRKRQGLLKLKPVMDYFRASAFPELKKIMVVCFHKDVAQSYVKAFLKAKRKVSLETGDMPAKGRADRLRAYAAQPDADLVVTIDAVSEGHDLNEFPHMFFTETDWRLYKILQVCGRNRRIDQTRRVFWNHFTLDRGVEKIMGSRLNQKASDIDKITGAGNGHKKLAFVK